MYRVFGKNEFDYAIAEELMTYTYKESSDELLEAFYSDGLDLKDDNQYEIAFANQKKEYINFLEEFLNEPKRTQFAAVYYNENKIASALRMIELKPGEWFLEALETAPLERRKAFGKFLVCNLIEDIKLRGGKSIIAHVHKTNQESIGLHERCGFKATDQQVYDEDGKHYKNHIRFEYIL